MDPRFPDGVQAVLVEGGIAAGSALKRAAQQELMETPPLPGIVT